MQPRLALLAASLGLASVRQAAFAQQPTPKPEFEVASIRPGSGKPTTLPNGMQVIGAMQGGPGSPDPERLTGNSVSLRSLLLSAYSVQNLQIVGPDWINTTRYDVTAKIPPGATKDDFRLMLQNLLEDRFNMKIHHETRDFPSYNLVIARGGLKLRETVSIDACASGGHPVGKTCPDGVNYISGIAKPAADAKASGLSMSPPKDGTGNIVTGRNALLATLASMLQNSLKGSVIADKTGLTDKYDFRFEFSPPDVGTAGDFAAPSLFTALEKDLGLKLEATKTQLDCVVIDHIQQPSDN
jgi:uncharacterized protein (TIGR03435 family)